MICCWRKSMLFHPTPHVMVLHSWRSLCIQSVHISVIDLKSRCQVSPKKYWTWIQTSLQVWYTQLPFLALSSSTISSGHLQAWSDLDQNGHNVFRNQCPLKCDCELYPKRMALPGPSQRKLPKDVMLENSGHLLTRSLWVKLSAFIYLVENHLENSPRALSPPFSDTYTP